MYTESEYERIGPWIWGPDRQPGQRHRRRGGGGQRRHGIGALKAPWLALARTGAERALFARIRSRRV